MFCEKCGSQVENNEKFCGSCGAVVDRQKPSVGNVQSTKTNNHKKIGMITCAVVLLVVIGIITIFISGNNIDRSLVGTWEPTARGDTSQFKFHRGGSGVVILSAWGDEMAFTWRVDREGRLWRQYNGEGDEWWAYYEIEGDLLWITSEWGNTWEYRKVR